MSKVRVGRQLIEGTNAVRLYHTRILLSKKRLPIIQGHVSEVAHWAFLLQQREAAAEMNIPVKDPMLKAMFSDAEGELTHPVVLQVLELPGVAFAIAAGYTLAVFKGAQYEWEEFETSILRLLTTFSLDLPDATIAEETE